MKEKAELQQQVAELRHQAALAPAENVLVAAAGSNAAESSRQLEEAVTPETRLVSVMAANNEIGVLQPLAALASICRKHGIHYNTGSFMSQYKTVLQRVLRYSLPERRSANPVNV